MSAVSDTLKSREKLSQNLRDNLGWALSLFLAGLAGQFWLIHSFGTQVPYADQWDAEAQNLFIPFLDGHYPLSHLFSAHGQHRILFTRLCNLGLFLLNGQWDNQVEMVFNSIIHCLGMGAFGWMMAQLLGRKFWLLLWPALVLALVLPFAWENTLWGFQSQFYFLIFFSFFTIRLLALDEPMSRGWRWGVIMAIVTLFTMASGFLAAAVVICLAILDILKERQSWRRHLPTFAVCMIMIGAGFVSKPSLPDAYVFVADSIRSLLLSLGKNLAWPCITMPLFGLVNLFPLAVMGWLYFKSRGRRLPAERMVLGIGLWVVLQALAIAYARGVAGRVPTSRYLDVFSFIAIANLLCVALVLARHRGRLSHAFIVYAGFAVWGIGCGAGIWELTQGDLRVEIPDQVNCQQARLESMRTFLVTDKMEVLELSGDCNYLPIGQQARLLRNQHIRSILPSGLREPLKIVPVPGAEDAFTRNGAQLAEPEAAGEIYWGSYSTNGAATRGRFESLPIKKSSLPFLEIPVAGDLGQIGLSLELVEIATGKTVTVQPPRYAGGHWLSVPVRAPAGDFKIVARDESETKWLAFKEPRELGRLSLWAMQLLAAWKYILAIGLGCLLVNVAMIAGGRRARLMQPPA